MDSPFQLCERGVRVGRGGGQRGPLSLRVLARSSISASLPVCSACAAQRRSHNAVVLFLPWETAGEIFSPRFVSAAHRTRALDGGFARRATAHLLSVPFPLPSCRTRVALSHETLSKGLRVACESGRSGGMPALISRGALGATGRIRGRACMASFAFRQVSHLAISFTRLGWFLKRVKAEVARREDQTFQAEWQWRAARVAGQHKTRFMRDTTRGKRLLSGVAHSLASCSSVSMLTEYASAFASAGSSAASPAGRSPEDFTTDLSVIAHLSPCTDGTSGSPAGRETAVTAPRVL